MKKLVVILAITLSACSTQPATTPAADSPELSAWKTRAEGVTIIRDDWGVPHIYGKTDADVVFGLMYAQAEDDFNRVETNFINSQGRLAEAEGEAEIWRDLRMKLFIDPADMKAQYAKAEPWLKALMDGWADGLNFYLATHPDVKPRAIARFEPWMALSFSEGSIGGDIERVNLRDLEAFYGQNPPSHTNTATRFGGRLVRWTSRSLVAAAGGADRIEWRRDRRREHRLRQGDAVNQPAYLVLLSRRSADGERRGPQRLRRADLGTVFHLPGLQRQGRLDAHLEQRRQHRRVSRDRHEAAGRQLHLSRRHRREAADREKDRRPLQVGQRSGAEGIHHLSHAPRADRQAIGRTSGSACA